MQISHQKIGREFPPFIIAEMSGNHNQSLERALEIVDAAANSGAHAIKLQTYTADTMTLDVDQPGFTIYDDKSLWKGKTLYNLYQEAHTPWEWHGPIFEFAKKIGIIAFSTPFDDSSVDYLEKLNVPCYKIASFENTDLPLIQKVAATGKPIIVSTGMASIAELDETVRTIRSTGNRNIVLLKCTSSYPASPRDTNLLTIPHLREMFNCEVGLSDHTLGVGVPVASVALGASVIEKHFTLNRADGGVDSAFSMEPSEFAQMVTETEKARLAIGQVNYSLSEAEKKSLKFRRSLYIVQDLKAGDILTQENVRAIRPGLGLPTKYLGIVMGKIVKHDVERGTALDWGLL